MNTVTFPYKVRRALTIEDQVRLGAEMASAAAKLEQLDEELKEIRDQYKSRVSAAEATVGRCQRALNNGWQMADVPCYWVMDHPTYGAKSIIRTDTGEVVQTEPMEDFDRQRVLEFEVVGSRAAEGTVDPEPDPAPNPNDPRCTLTGPQGEVLLDMKSSELREVAGKLKKARN